MSVQPLVLIVDDDPLTQAVVEMRLQVAGCRTAVAQDGCEALTWMQSARPDAVVLDAFMPRVDGFEVLRRMKASPALRHVPVVVLTALRRDADMTAALQAGASAYVSKPFDPNELAGCVAELARSSKCP
jgi:CheY-like chemotaxis protein